MNKKICIGIIILGLLFVSGCMDESPNIMPMTIQGNLTENINLTKTIRITTAPIEQFCSDIEMEYVAPFTSLPSCMDKNNKIHFFMIDVDEDKLLWYIGNMTYKMDIEVETLVDKN